MPMILLIEDDPTIRITMEFALTRAGYAVASCADGSEGLERARSVSPDLILLDIMLPGMDGFAITAALRDDGDRTPIIMLTALSSDDDKIKGLDAGADDYITKPFSTDVLLARIRANMRRAKDGQPHQAGLMTFGDLSIDADAARVTVKDEPVTLRGKEYAILLALASCEGTLCRRDWLTQEVWKEEFLSTSRTIDVHIRRIRQAIEDPSDYTYIQTVHGMGYRFEVLPKNQSATHEGD